MALKRLRAIESQEELPADRFTKKAYGPVPSERICVAYIVSYCSPTNSISVINGSPNLLNGTGFKLVMEEIQREFESDLHIQWSINTRITEFSLTIEPIFGVATRNVIRIQNKPRGANGSGTSISLCKKYQLCILCINNFRLCVAALEHNIVSIITWLVAA